MIPFKDIIIIMVLAVIFKCIWSLINFVFYAIRLDYEIRTLSDMSKEQKDSIRNVGK